MKPVVVTTNLKAFSDTAMELAVHIANKEGVDIRVCWVGDKDAVLPDGRAASEALQAICDRYASRMAVGTVGYDIREGDVVDSVCAYVKEQEATLLIIGSTTPGKREEIKDSKHIRILYRSDVPVLLLPLSFKPQEKYGPIVVSVTSDPTTRAKLPYAVHLAKLFDTSVHVLSLIENNSERPTMRAYLSQCEQYLEAQGVAFAGAIRDYTDFFTAMADYIESVGASFAVYYTERESLIKRITHTTAVKRAKRESNVPILGVHPDNTLVNIRL